MRTRWRRVVQSWRLVGALINARLRAKPILLSHLVTCRCPCRCETCLWRGLVAEELTAGQIGEFYRDAAKAGILVNSIWGGEPMIRQDLPEILRASHEAGFVTVLITSGWRFHERFEEVIPWPDLVIFSLDFPSAQHDALRGVPGLHDSVAEGIRRIKALPNGPRVAVNSVISRLNQDVVPDLAEWARARSAPIYFHPIETGWPGQQAGTATKEALAVDEDKLAEVFQGLIALKKRGYPIANSLPYLRTFNHGKQPYRCHARKVCLQLWPNGDLRDCLDRTRAVVNVRETSLLDVLKRPEVRQRRLRPVDCNVCNNANVIDTSYLWELRPGSIFALLRSHVQTVVS